MASSNKTLWKARLVATFWTLLGLYAGSKFHFFRIIYDTRFMSLIPGTLFRLALITLVTVFVWTAKILQKESPDFQRRGSLGALVAGMVASSEQPSTQLPGGRVVASRCRANELKTFGNEHDVNSPSHSTSAPLLPGETRQAYARFLRKRESAARKLALLGLYTRDSLVDRNRRPAAPQGNRNSKHGEPPAHSYPLDPADCYGNRPRGIVSHCQLPPPAPHAGSAHRSSVGSSTAGQATSWLRRHLTGVQGERKLLFTPRTVLGAPRALPAIAHLSLLCVALFVIASYRVYGCVAGPLVIVVVCGMSNLTEILSIIVPQTPLLRAALAFAIFVVISLLSPFPESNYSQALSFSGSYTAMFLVLLTAVGVLIYIGLMAIYSLSSAGYYPHLVPHVLSSYVRKLKISTVNHFSIYASAADSAISYDETNSQDLTGEGDDVTTTATPPCKKVMSCRSKWNITNSTKATAVRRPAPSAAPTVALPWLQTRDCF